MDTKENQSIETLKLRRTMGDNAEGTIPTKLSGLEFNMKYKLLTSRRDPASFSHYWLPEKR